MMEGGSEFSDVLTYEGCNYLRQRLVLSTLSSRPVRIVKIRENADEPGLREFEAGFVRLLDKLTNGTHIEVSETGTSLLYRPGVLVGGALDHECSGQRGVGYFLEPLVLLAPFAKKPLRVTLRGVTDAPNDPSVDYYRMCVLPLLKRLLPDNELEIKLVHRGLHPSGRGEVWFSCPVVRRVQPLLLTDEGRVKRVRGMAYCSCVSPAMANRVVDGARSVLNHYLPDVYIYTDVVKRRDGKRCPGYGLSLVAEGTTRVTHGAELGSCQGDPSARGRPGTLLPEDVGRGCARELLAEVVRGGCVDTGCQAIVLTFMALTQHDVSKVELGPLTPYSTQLLRHIRDFFNLTYRVETRTEELGEGGVSRSKVILTCVGVGFSNFSKGLT